jgi:drug/metabolite transporter (DMT)-like permease
MNSVFFYSLFILFGTLISSISQVMLKKAAMMQYDSVVKEYMNPLVIGAYVLFFAATLCSIIAYKGIPLSLGAVLEATSYIYVTYFGVTIFHESINTKKIIALILIIAGILVYSLAGGQ